MTMLNDEYQTVVGSVTEIRDTHKKPVAKTDPIKIFFLSGIFNLKIEGIGSENMAKSEMILKIPVARKRS